MCVLLYLSELRSVCVRAGVCACGCVCVCVCVCKQHLNWNGKYNMSSALHQKTFLSMMINTYIFVIFAFALEEEADCN